MTEKRYLKWYNKVGYGSGDIAGNVLNAHASFRTYVKSCVTNTKSHLFILRMTCRLHIMYPIISQPCIVAA